jgi:hypothetical protein
VSDRRQRRANPAATLGFLHILPTQPELQLLHRWLDTWNGIGLIAAGMHRQGLRLSLSLSIVAPGGSRLADAGAV